ncbi:MULTISPECIES: PucR family transcriptional regulator [Bacillaceae]|nr:MULTISPECIES: PucR family transcriptional regulator [Bacillaceae]MCE4049813.1 PucR family transcriptional regulator ligand-binding domain-containing protein [Bacillus sp. Au-Bac7]UPO87575.1 PucR family transcriptional regulator ligand-binding domain-containing protein [Niallia sp. Man26]
MNPSGITLEELLMLPVLREASVISGKEGLCRVVQFIDIMEVPDIDGWLREGELLLTTAYSLRDDLSKLPKVVEMLAKANAAALAIKPERYLHEMPQEMIDLSNQHQLPIIQLPPGIPYIDITNAVMEQILNKQASLLRRSEEIYKKLTTLVLENSGIQVVADNVSQMLNAPISLLDKHGNMIVSSNSITSETSANMSYWDITVDKEHVGTFILQKESLDEMEMVCVEQARLVFSLELMRRKTAVDTENRLRGSFMEELIAGIYLPQDEVVTKSRQFGLNPDAMWQVVVFELQGLLEEDAGMLVQLQTSLKELEGLQGIKIYSLFQGNRLVIIQSSSSNSLWRPEHWSKQLEPFTKRYKGLQVGIGGYSLLWDIHLSYQEARNAVKIGRSLNNDQQLHNFDDVELFKLLLDSTEYINFDAVIERKIGKLLSYDRETGSELVKTLFYYLSTNGSLLETGEQLFIHRNSVKYRIDKVKEMSGLKLESFYEKFSCYLCIYFHLFRISR